MTSPEGSGNALQFEADWTIVRWAFPIQPRICARK
jgi:hypothetical protein